MAAPALDDQKNDQSPQIFTWALGARGARGGVKKLTGRVITAQR
jgi:hypothetical protein